MARNVLQKTILLYLLKVSKELCRPEDIKTTLEEAKGTKKVPTVIEFIIDPEENVLPIVPPGNPLSDMIMGGTGND